MSDTGRDLQPQDLLIQFWSMPLRIMESWASMWMGVANAGPREIDADEGGEQLPVPNPHQEAKDEALFA